MDNLNFHIETVSRSEWLVAWERSPHATFFEHPDWFDSWKIMYPQSKGNGAVRCVSDHRIDFIIPYLKRGLTKGLITHYECGPGGLYSGPLGFPPDFSFNDYHILDSIFDSLFANYSFRLNPYLVGCAEQITTNPSLFTQATELNDFERVEAELQKSGVLYDSRYGERNGLRIQKSTPESALQFCNVYEKLRQTWESPGSYYPQEFFLSLMKSGQCDTWSVFKDDTYVGGAIILKGVNQVSSWLTIMDPDHTKLRPYEFTYHNLLNYYNEAGYRWFDFNPSAGLDGVVQFKAKFATSKVFYAEYHRHDRFARVISKVMKYLK